MFLVFTKDIMLLQAIYHLIKTDVIVHIQHAEDFCTIEERNVKVIIDTFNNNIFYTSIDYQLERIQPAKVFILAPFRIKRCFGDIPVVLSIETFRCMLSLLC